MPKQYCWMEHCTLEEGSLQGGSEVMLDCTLVNVESSWTATDTPTFRYALTIYDSHLLLVGGNCYPSQQTTNKVYTMIDGGFKELLPPMKDKRCSSSAVSSASVLVVAGGWGDSQLSSVEVYNYGQWTYKQSLPCACFNATLALYSDELIVIGGERQGTKVYRISLQSLVSGTEQSPWETLPDVPFKNSAAAVFGGRILTIGGWKYPKSTSSIHAYSPNTQSWLHVGDIPKPLQDTCAIVLPTEELIVIGGLDKRTNSKHVFRAFIRG